MVETRVPMNQAESMPIKTKIVLGSALPVKKRRYWSSREILMRYVLTT